MIIRRYNIVNNRYSNASIPSDWKISTNEVNDNVKINCIHCGMSISYKDSFESKRYKDEHDRGYRECETCYNNFLPLTKFGK